MISSTLAPLVSSRLRRRGFTLVEMLVAVTIMAMLLTMVVLAVRHVRSSAQRTRTAADLQAVASALDAYHADFGSYPPVPPGAANLGAHILCQALIAPGPAAGAPQDEPDGADGPGFRIRDTRGRIYGPYLQPEKFIVSSGTPVLVPAAATICDRNQRPILYFPALTKNPQVNRPRGNGGTAGGYLDAYVPNPGAPFPMYDASHNIGAFIYDREDNAVALMRLQVMLGDTNFNGCIDAGEKAAGTEPFLLWAAGEDGLFGPPPRPYVPPHPRGSPFPPNGYPGPPPTPAQTAAAVSKCDDVTNFR